MYNLIVFFVITSYLFNLILFIFKFELIFLKKNIVKGGTSPNVARGCSSNTAGCQNAIYGALSFGTFNYCCWNNYCNSAFKIDAKINNIYFLMLSIVSLFLVRQLN